MSWKNRAEKIDETSSWKNRAEVLEQAPVEAEDEGSGLLSYRGLLKGTAEALPYAGGFLGGAVGLPFGPVTAAAGAGLGAGAGKSLENLIESQLLDEPKTRKEIWTEPAIETGLGAVGEGAGGLIGKGVSKAAASKPVKAITKGLSTVGQKVGKALTGIPEKAIETYSKYADEIAQMTKSADGDVQEAADLLRSKFTSTIQGTRRQLNEQIGNTLEKLGKDKIIEITPVLDALEAQKNMLDPRFSEQAAQVAEIQGFIDELSQIAPTGKMPLIEAQTLKNIMQERAQGAYQKAGQIFQYGKDSQKAARSAAAVARQYINKAAPEIAQANETLAKLHKIERNMNKNLIAEGKPAAALMGAGSGGNPQNIKYLRELGDITGTDMLGDAEKLYAMKVFNEAPIMPMDTTGKSATRMGMGAGAGFAFGGYPGAAMGAAATSPLALKAGIKSGQAVGGGAQKMLRPDQVKALLLRKGLLNQDRMNEQ